MKIHKKFECGKDRKKMEDITASYEDEKNEMKY